MIRMILPLPEFDLNSLRSSPRDIVKTVEHNCGNLPISLIRFFLDQEKKRDILMKSAAEVMGRRKCG